MKRKTREERFWSGVDIRDANDCWEWKKFREPDDGYGRFVMGKEQLAHRASWIFTYGEIPEGIKVLHKCDNPPCCNPKHLFLGTIADNNKDRQKKGRTVIPDNRGSRHGMARLNEDDVVKILSLSKQGFTNSEIAKMFNHVGNATVRDVIARRTWVHITI